MTGGDKRVVVLTGGVGGAKLVMGLNEIVPGDRLTAIVNTGDDFEHLGLWVSPDIDTLLYTLSGKANRAQGWGRKGESWSFMAAVRELGGEDWFNLGDGDLALHVLRTDRLRRGDRLSAVVRDFAAAWDIGCAILPMSDGRIETRPVTDRGEMPFQRYFVEHRCAPRVERILFRGAAEAAAAPGVVAAIEQADAILVAPSNPYLSVDPMLAVPEIRAALSARRAPAVAVSPIIGGQAVKGPTAKLMAELGVPVDNAAIAAHYDGLIDGLLIDGGDEAPAGVAVGRADTLMTTLEDKVRVAAAALALAARVAA